MVNNKNIQIIITFIKCMKVYFLLKAEIIFDYSDNPTIISVLEPLKGKSGWMKVSNLAVEAFEAEDHVIVCAIDEDGNSINSEVSRKIFSLSASGVVVGVVAGRSCGGVVVGTRGVTSSVEVPLSVSSNTSLVVVAVVVATTSTTSSPPTS
mgnify:CR=1 FL=1